MLDRDLDDTDIDHLPSKGIRGSLRQLYLAETRNLKRFDAYEPGAEYYNQTYPRLKEVTFFYHAHCCQMQDHFFYTEQVKRELAAIDYSVQFKRDTATVSNGVSEYVYVNISDRSVVVDNANITECENVSVSDFCSSEFCIRSVCGRCFFEPDKVSFSGNAESEIYCIQKAPLSCLDKFYSVDTNATQIMRNSCIPAPTTPPSEPPDVCNEPEKWCDATQTAHNIAFCKDTCIHLDGCEHPECPQELQDCPNICFRKRAADRGELYPDIIYPHLIRRSEENSNDTSESDCGIVLLDVICRQRLNSTDDDNITECPYGDLEDIGEYLLPTGWFYADSDSKNTICKEQVETTTSPTTLPLPPLPPVPLVRGSITDCAPVPDDFNPCEDLLGDSDFLRAVIWLVIIFGVLGNGLVLFVFVVHTVIIRRMKVRFFPMHFFYANLATADLLMSIYLLTIASVDARTKGRFSVYDVEWRTGPGCGFAGFCAITSTVVSVYTLVVITTERLYTITFVMRQRKVSKLFALAVMTFGWVLGIVMGMLPLVGVNSYQLVAICLPFDNDGASARAYIVFILLMTGLAFVYIAISYAIIFYQVMLSPSKRKLVRSGGHSKQWKANLRMSLRIFSLVVTNIICWFPIALVSLTAAFGVPLQGINVATAKVFVVFVFPLNACVNPFLYSLSTRAFKHNLYALFMRCGLCRDSSYVAANSDLFGVPSISSARTSDTTASRRSSVISQLVALNFTMFVNRRASTASNTLSNSSTNLHRPGEVRRGSFEGILMEDSMLRRGSGFSESSSEGLSCAQVAPQIVPLRYNPRNTLTSASSLSVLPEVDETTDLTKAEAIIRVNPGYLDQDDPECKVSNQEHTSDTDTPICNGRALVNSRLVAEDTFNIADTFHNEFIPNNVLQTEGDSEEQSDTMSDPDHTHPQDPNQINHEDDS